MPCGKQKVYLSLSDVMPNDAIYKKTKRKITPSSEPMAMPIAPPPVQVEERIPPQKETVQTPMDSPPQVDVPKPAPTAPHWKETISSCYLPLFNNS